MRTNFHKAYLVTALLCLMVNLCAAQSFDNIAAAFKAGNASSIAKNFETNVEITVKTGATSYSKSQAEMVLKNFFASHKPSAFAVVHQGTSPQGLKFYLGTLNTTSGNYRTYILAKNVKGSLVIQEIKFDEAP